MHLLDSLLTLLLVEAFVLFLIILFIFVLNGVSSLVTCQYRQSAVDGSSSFSSLCSNVRRTVDVERSVLSPSIKRNWRGHRPRISCRFRFSQLYPEDVLCKFEFDIIARAMTRVSCDRGRRDMERVGQHRKYDNFLSEKGIAYPRSWEVTNHYRKSWSSWWRHIYAGSSSPGNDYSFTKVTSGRRISKATGFFDKFDWKSTRSRKTFSKGRTTFDSWPQQRQRYDRALPQSSSRSVSFRAKKVATAWSQLLWQTSYLQGTPSIEITKEINTVISPSDWSTVGR